VATAEELRGAVQVAAADSDVVVMAAAVADYRPREVATTKHKRSLSGWSVALEPTPDVLAELVSGRTAGQTVVGFAAETGDADGDWREHGRRKLARKGCDMLVVNPVGAGLAFGTPDNEVLVLSCASDGSVSEREVARTSKRRVADTVWDEVVALRRSGVNASNSDQPS
jgi:phosphopantothenoylcysteine decarboxylase/phosphopantothenate--cysteine ligase